MYILHLSLPPKLSFFGNLQIILYQINHSFQGRLIILVKLSPLEVVEFVIPEQLYTWRLKSIEEGMQNHQNRNIEITEYFVKEQDKHMRISTIVQ